AEFVLPFRFTNTDRTVSEGRICGYEEADEDGAAVEEAADDFAEEAVDDAAGDPAEERFGPRSDLFSAPSAR
ncbi:MAG: hypothetical protein WCG94_06585, partial [Methanothrix sp.]